MDAEARRRVAAQWQRDNKAELGCPRAAVVAAVAAIDDWVDANLTSFNQALPAAFRTGATAAQKADLFMYVLMRRQGRLRAEEDG